MPSTKTSCFEMDRRQFMKLTGTMGVGSMFVNPIELLAADKCTQIFTTNGNVKATEAGATLQFWIDGLHFLKNHTDLPSRANITLFMDLKQTPTSHVESVTLMDSNFNTISTRYFDASMKMISGHVPYVRFENVQIDIDKEYHVVYTVRTGSSIKLFKAPIKDPDTGKPTVSRLNTTWLPQKMRNDFKSFLLRSTTNPTPGLITTQFQFYTQNGLASHCARGKMDAIGSDGSFTCKIDFMHGDSGADHFMRYFIVMDPVGRILGFKRRAGPGDQKEPGPTVNVSSINDDNATKSSFDVPDLQIADIRDCPYIQFYTEDSYDAIARNIIRLR